jgi:hypothetical protein
VRIVGEPERGLDVRSPEYGRVIEQRRPAVDVGSIVVGACDGALPHAPGDERAVVPFGAAAASGQRRGTKPVPVGHDRDDRAEVQAGLRPRRG